MLEEGETFFAEEENWEKLVSIFADFHEELE